MDALRSLPAGFRRAATWLAWFGAVLAVYRAGIEVLPLKDHAVFMLGRELYRDDWKWFLDVLSYNRTQSLLPGDYLSFRPLHMAIIATSDILFRHDFLAQGILGCAMFATTATLLFAVGRRLCGAPTAIAAVLAWISLAAGASIVLWQHIAPYSLAPGLLAAALLLLYGTPGRPRSAAACVFLACLLNELPVLASTALAAWFLRALPPERRLRHAAVFLVPAFAALALNAVDFLWIHPAPSVMGSIRPIGTWRALGCFWIWLGSVGAGLLAPWLVAFGRFGYENFLFYWPFWESGTLALSLCAVPPCAFLIFHGREVLRRVSREEDEFRPAAGALFLAVFAGAALICAYRLVTRDIDYLAGSTYYYSTLHFALVGALLVLLARHPNPGRRHLLPALLLLAAAAGHYAILQRELATVGKISAPLLRTVGQARAFFEENPSFHYAGTNALPSCWGVLFHDAGESRRPGTEPLYLLGNPKAFAALCRVGLPPSSAEFDRVPLSPDSAASIRSRGMTVLAAQVPYGHEIRFVTERIGRFRIMFEGDSEGRVGFYVIRNMVQRQYPDSYETGTTIDFDASTSRIDWRIRFLGDSVFLVANGSIPIAIPAFSTPSKRIAVEIVSRDGRIGEMKEILVGRNPDAGDLSIDPVRKLAAGDAPR